MRIDRRSYTTRFMDMVRKDESGCWLWRGGTAKGYGVFTVARRNVYAHRFAYATFVGAIGNLFVLHSCDCTICCNPEHLFLGTQQDNMDDKVKKNRQMKGQHHWNAKLTLEQVNAIRKALLEGHELEVIAKQYAVSVGHVRSIESGGRW